jgi:hypothetical protein
MTNCFLPDIRLPMRHLHVIKKATDSSGHSQNRTLAMAISLGTPMVLLTWNIMEKITADLVNVNSCLSSPPHPGHQVLPKKSVILVNSTNFIAIPLSSQSNQVKSRNITEPSQSPKRCPQ